MKPTHLSGGLAVAGLCLALAGAVSAQDASLGVIANVTVVDTRDGSLSPGQAVVIRDGRIETVTDMAGLTIPEGAEVIDAGGQFVVPGYLDMHAHALMLPGGDDDDDHGHSHDNGIDDQSVVWNLMLANGVTGFREMSGSAERIAHGRAVNAASAAGEIDAPEVLGSLGAMFLGQAQTPEDGVAFVQARLAEGADFLKIFGGRPDVVLAMLDEARANNLPVAGHLPQLNDTAELSRRGWTAIEHLGGGWGFLIDCSPAAPAIRERLAQQQAGGPQQLPPTFILNPQLYIGNATAPVYQGVMGSHDPARCEALGQTFIDNDTWQIPTLIRLRTMNEGGAAHFREDPNLRYLAPEARAQWESLGQQFAETVTPETQATLAAFYELQLQVIGQMQAQGVRMLAGSDLGGIWVLPGFGLHQEFAELARAGFSPLEVLQATTLHAAEFLGRDDLGTVAEGRRADLVLLSANPLEDVANLASIAGVFLHGRHFPAEALDAMREAVAARYAD